jgi:hypothetical protein
VHVSHPSADAGEGRIDRVGPDLVPGHWTAGSYAAPELLAD